MYNAESASEMADLPDDVFPDGSITRIVYHNFLTYDNVECKPGPNLNVFIGPNGAGKSTVICGICLAVGGNPNVLGRSERIGDYIKHKRDEGFVELSIADSQNGEQRVKILLQRPNSCTYFINGSRVDNPCTFLAQDKVKSFSEQSAVDLLINTERAGNPRLLEKHEELIKKKKLETVHIENAREVQQRLEAVEDLCKENEKRTAKENEHGADHKEVVSAFLSSLFDARLLNTLSFYFQLRQIREVTSEIRSALEQFDRVKISKENWKDEVSQMKNQRDRVQEQVVAAKEGMKGLRDEERNISEAMKTRLRILGNLRINMADEAWRWYEGNRDKFRYPVFVPVLHMTVPDARSAMLLENLIAFRDLPMFIFGCKEDEALLTDRRHSWKLNSTVIPPSQVDVSSLKTRLTPEMEELGFTHFAVDLFDSVDVVKQYLCNVAKLHQVPIGSSKTNDLYDTIRTIFLKNAYRLYLTDKYRVQFTVSKYGSHEMLGQQSELKAPARIFTSHSKQLDDKSRFHDQAQRIRDWEADLRNRRQQMNQSRTKIQAEKEELKAQQAEWRSRRDALWDLERSLHSRERKIEDLLANRPDINQAAADLSKAKITAAREVYKVTLKLLCKLEKLRVASIRECFLRVTLKQLRDEGTKFEKDLQNLEEKLQENRSSLQRHVESFLCVKRDLIGMTECLHDKCGVKTLNLEQMTPKEKEILECLEKLFIDEHIPDDMSMVLQLLEEEKIKLRLATVDGSKEDFDRYEFLKGEKISLVSRREQQEATREEWKASLMKEIIEWREPIEELIQNINVNYSKFFAQIGCAGEVYLDRPEDPLNIAEYGIMIMVSFRSGERLKRLNHQVRMLSSSCFLVVLKKTIYAKVQSGGERSVSTMLYLLALQELCPVPFRCVDEINQGMDPVNERKVFNIIVDTLSGEGNLAKTQYFL
ncbi:unnamed protein product [Angiostrongylus costaricensis]|uniref:Structural maintenance of chromosomes protein 5 n=1 Tax=Angiostrongylus costaricensis TaxID=334426 RepID=A0A0R3PQR1_ANGCS|nr:unnamed protein product [Angiostrongylus costaricensis]